MMSAEARIGARADHRLPALQQPDWPDRTALRRVCEQLVDEAEPVDVWSCRALRDELSRAVSGDGFVVIGGDCAERFAETAPGWITAKAEQLHRAADVIETATGLPTTRIGRFGGQFAKPRSQDYEELSDGRRVLSYRGDAVNGLDVDERAYDPARLLTASVRLPSGTFSAGRRRVKRVRDPRHAPISATRRCSSTTSGRSCAIGGDTHPADTSCGSAIGRGTPITRTFASHRASRTPSE
jgi:hypothetical protein